MEMDEEAVRKVSSHESGVISSEFKVQSQDQMKGDKQSAKSLQIREIRDKRKPSGIPDGRFSRLKRDPDILMEQPG